MATPVYIEEEVGRKWDQCISDTLIKLGGGLVLGTVFSVLFFKRTKWPVVLSAGIGIGIAYTNCEADMNATLRASKSQSKNQ